MLQSKILTFEIFICIYIYIYIYTLVAYFLFYFIYFVICNYLVVHSKLFYLYINNSLLFYLNQVIYSYCLLQNRIELLIQKLYNCSDGTISSFTYSISIFFLFFLLLYTVLVISSYSLESRSNATILILQ